MPSWKKCSFTGHRVINPIHIEKMTELLTRAINYAYSQGCRDFLSGGAIGFDTLAAREIIRFRMSHPDVRLIMVLPCINQDERWTDRQRSSYEFILANSDEAVYVSDSYSPDCMRMRNERLAEECDILIAYVERVQSGSGQTLAMARRLGKEIYNLFPSLNK